MTSTNKEQVKNQPKATFNNQVRSANVIGNCTEETFIFGADQVFVGIENPEETEIAANSNGFKYERNKVEGVEVYNLHTQAHHCWLLVDLETGGRGWYPGSKEVVDIVEAILYQEPDDTSSIIANVGTFTTLEKLDLVYGRSSETSKKIVYCKVKYAGIECYLKNSKVLNTRYIDRKS